MQMYKSLPQTHDTFFTSINFLTCQNSILKCYVNCLCLICHKQSWSPDKTNPSQWTSPCEPVPQCPSPKCPSPWAAQLMMPGFLKLCVSAIQCSAISNRSIFDIYNSHDSSPVWLLCHLIQVGLIHLPVQELPGSIFHAFFWNFEKINIFRRIILPNSIPSNIAEINGLKSYEVGVGRHVRFLWRHIFLPCEKKMNELHNISEK